MVGALAARAKRTSPRCPGARGAVQAISHASAARWSSGYMGLRSGREEKEAKTCTGEVITCHGLVCHKLNVKLGRGCQGQEGQRDDLPEDTQSSVHASLATRRGEEWSQDKTRHVVNMWRSPRKVGRQKRETARPLAQLSLWSSSYGARGGRHQGASSQRGRVGEDECEREEHWSSGCMGLEAAGRSERRK